METPDFKKLSTNEVQQGYMLRIWDYFNLNHDDPYDIANFLAALTKLHEFLLGHFLYNAEETLQLPRDLWLKCIEAAKDDWPSIYDQWEKGTSGKLPQYQSLIFQAYKWASESDKEILAKNYPQWFKNQDVLADQEL